MPDEQFTQRSKGQNRFRPLRLQVQRTTASDDNRQQVRCFPYKSTARAWQGTSPEDPQACSRERFPSPNCRLLLSSDARCRLLWFANSLP
jgi:hypothetical protein